MADAALVWRDLRAEEMIRLHRDEGWSLVEIGERFGVSRERVRQIMKDYGFVSGRKGRRPGPSPGTLLAVERAESLVRENPGTTRADLQRALGVAYTTIGPYLGPEVREALDAAGIARYRAPLYTDEDLIDEIRVAAGELGEPLGARRFDRWSGYGRSQLMMLRFGSWAEACRRAGVRCGTVADTAVAAGLGRRRFSGEDCLSAMREAARRSGSARLTYAGYEAYASKGAPSGTTVRKRFGSWSAACREAGLP